MNTPCAQKCWLRLLAGFSAIAVTMCFSSCVSAPHEASQPMLSVLAQFENAPAKGSAEANLPARVLPAAVAGQQWPGSGLAQHPFLYYGEGINVLYVVNHGRIVWTYAFPPGGEIDDAWMLSNGHIICTTMNDCYEVTPQKEIVWAYHCPPNTQIHALQPMGLDQVMLVENGLPPHLYILNKKDNAKALARDLPAISLTDPKTIHPQFRNCRVTAQGTFLLPFLMEGRIEEYDKDGKKIWTYKTQKPWSAVRLQNGNTLIPGDNLGYVHEVNPQGEVVWALEATTLPGIKLTDVQTVARLDNGNTVICNRGNGSPAQVIEVTPDKKVVWVLQDYQNLPACTGIQLLDQPGIPENPGDFRR